MAIDELDKLDYLTIERDLGEVVLYISDHLDWETDPAQHLSLLQHKVHRYLAFCTKGELIRRYPNAAGRKHVIQIVGQHPVPDRLKEFFGQLKVAAVKAGVDLRFTLLDNL